MDGHLINGECFNVVSKSVSPMICVSPNQWTIARLLTVAMLPTVIPQGNAWRGVEIESCLFFASDSSVIVTISHSCLRNVTRLNEQVIQI